ncbi:MAG: S41 family peptidase [Fischerella sp. CENA71]|nr:S41 family peptidase [Fischerella sp. CENA71]
MGRDPQVIRVGENTQGVFSDVLERELPNGWQFGLPNELFLTEDGKFFDVTGIPPNILVSVLQSKDLNAGRDSGLEKALQILSAIAR